MESYEVVPVGRAKNITGATFGRLTAVFRVKHSVRPHWLCECVCGNEKVISARNLQSGLTRSCGCLFKEMVGDNHPNYNPHLSDYERGKQRTEINGKSVKKWREKVFQRDDFTCQVCRKKGGKLNAHHLDGWNWCKDKRYDVKNGMILCRECHLGFHRVFGNGDNTRDQFTEWLNRSDESESL